MGKEMADVVQGNIGKLTDENHRLSMGKLEWIILLASIGGLLSFLML